MGEGSRRGSGRVRIFVGKRGSGRVGSMFRRVGSGPRKVIRGQLWFPLVRCTVVFLSARCIHCNTALCHFRVSSCALYCAIRGPIFYAQFAFPSVQCTVIFVFPYKHCTVWLVLNTI